MEPVAGPPRLRLGDSAGPAGCDPPGKRMDSAPGNLTEHGERDDRGCARVFSLDRSGAHAPNLRAIRLREEQRLPLELRVLTELRGRSRWVQTWTSPSTHGIQGSCGSKRCSRLLLLKLLTSDTMLTDSHVDYISYRILFDIVSFRACNTC